MLSRVDLVNFKCFEKLELRCAAINLLCGLNGMGKSSLLQALLVLRQSIETGELRRGRLVLGGERADLGTGLDVLFDGAQDDTVGFGLHNDETQEAWEMHFAYSQSADQLSAVGKDLAHDFVPDVWQDIPPLGGLLIYVSAERVGPRKLYPISYVRRCKPILDRVVSTLGVTSTATKAISWMQTTHDAVTHEGRKCET